MEDAISKTKKMPESPFLGRWRTVSMGTWDEDYINEEVPAFIEFDARGTGEFQFAYVRGGFDYRITTRDGEPAVEWSWESNDDQHDMSGRDWAVLRDNEQHGMIFIHLGDDPEFEAEQEAGRKRR